MLPELWEFLDRLVASSAIVIDRPRGSSHPRFPNLIYPLDYGYLDETTTIDGGGIDLFAGSLPERRLDALALTVDLEKRDAEIKLLLGCTPEEQTIILDFLNGASMRAMLVPRGTQMDWLRTRRSVRRFRPDSIPRVLLEQVIQTAAFAPSAHNRQPWRFVVLTTPAARDRLAHEMSIDFRRDLLGDGLPTEEVDAQVTRSSERIRSAPALVVLCQDITVGDAYPDAARQNAERLMGVQSVALSGGALLLAAHAAGLGGVWMCAPLFAPDAVRRALDLPAHWQPQAMILLGYPAVIPPARPRKPIDEVAVFL
jgi:F420 biosynthesis protein FbiB-like protein